MNGKLPARAKSTFKIQTPLGTAVNLEVPKGNCLADALKSVALYMGYQCEIELKPLTESEDNEN